MSTDLNWFKSRYSGDQGGACVEVAITWTKSSYSGDQGGNCVEVATCPHTVHVRDSKDTTHPALTLTPSAWSAFLHDLTYPTRFAEEKALAALKKWNGYAPEPAKQQDLDDELDRRLAQAGTR